MQQSIPEILNSLNQFLPEISLIATLLVCLILDIILRKKSLVVSVIALIGLAVTLYFSILETGLNKAIFSNMMAVDPYALFFKYIFIISSALIIIFFDISSEIKSATHHNEYTLLVLSLALGGFLMASAINMLMMYLSLELASLTSYIIAGYNKKIKRSSEAALKYVIYGAASSGIMLYGMSLLYGYTGSMNIYRISQYLAQPSALSSNPLLVVVLVMIAAGMGYKISSVPFHFWTPDVYEGSPTPVTAFLAVTSSAAGFSLIARFFLTTFLTSPNLIDGNIFPVISTIPWKTLLIIISVASMIVGNFVAVWQTSMKRILAYSSIAQAGYIMVGIIAGSKLGVTAMMIYIGAYLMMNLGAFLCTLMIVNKIGSDDIDDMKGLAYRSPAVCVAMAVFMLALAGIPATVGFIGKFYLISSLLEQGSGYIWLAVVLLLNSVVSLFFYFKVIKKMYLDKPEVEDLPKIKYSYGYYILLLVLAVPTVVLGLFFQPLLKIAEASSIFFGIK